MWHGIRSACWRLGLWVAAAMLSAVATAAEKSPPNVQTRPEAVELFSAIDKGQIEVQLIPKDSSECRLLITNKTDKPLTVMLPDVFAGVPVLAQQFPNANQKNRAPQQVGVGNNLFQNPRGNQNPQNPMFNVPNPMNNQRPGQRLFRGFNVAPEKVGQLKLPAVCLELGNPNPRAAIPYQLKPIEGVTTKPGVAEVCAMLGRGEVNQTAAQLAAWHLNNDVSWEKLAKLPRKLAIGTKPIYSAEEIKAGRKVAEKALELAKAQPTGTTSDK